MPYITGTGHCAAVAWQRHMHPSCTGKGKQLLGWGRPRTSVCIDLTPVSPSQLLEVQSLVSQGSWKNTLVTDPLVAEWQSTTDMVPTQACLRGRGRARRARLACPGTQGPPAARTSAARRCRMPHPPTPARSSRQRSRRPARCHSRSRWGGLIWWGACALVRAG